ncbi:16S rRNA (uracil(1498)-N(3))-methyltransferase [Halomonas denitrificans]|nr:16S rRNA (uracil(1498)-N(3))-methyltransferase [Halomonas denitrificans]
MRTIRLHSPVDLDPGTEVDLDPGAAHRLGRVLRRRPGDRVVVFNGDGRDAEAEIVALSGSTCRVRIESSIEVDTESRLVVHLVQAVAKGDKMDWLVQKAVELGVHAIHPVLTEHGDVRLDGARAEKRRTRWQEIAVSACEQCGRARIPEVALPRRLADWTPPHAVGLMLDPGADVALGRVEGAEAFALAIGPEGGFGSSDRGVLEASGFRAVRFGPRVLRTETAGAAALAVLQARFGDLDR